MICCCMHNSSCFAAQWLVCLLCKCFDTSSHICIRLQHYDASHIISARTAPVGTVAGHLCCQSNMHCEMHLYCSRLAHDGLVLCSNAQVNMLVLQEIPCLDSSQKPVRDANGASLQRPSHCGWLPKSFQAWWPLAKSCSRRYPNVFMLCSRPSTIMTPLCYKLYYRSLQLVPILPALTHMLAGVASLGTTNLQPCISTSS